MLILSILLMFQLNNGYKINSNSTSLDKNTNNKISLLVLPKITEIDQEEENKSSIIVPEQNKTQQNQQTIHLLSPNTSVVKDPEISCSLRFIIDVIKTINNITNKLGWISKRILSKVDKCFKNKVCDYNLKKGNITNIYEIERIIKKYNFNQSFSQDRLVQLVSGMKSETNASSNLSADLMTISDYLDSTNIRSIRSAGDDNKNGLEHSSKLSVAASQKDISYNTTWKALENDSENKTLIELDNNNNSGIVSKNEEQLGLTTVLERLTTVKVTDLYATTQTIVSSNPTEKIEPVSMFDESVRDFTNSPTIEIFPIKTSQATTELPVEKIRKNVTPPNDPYTNATNVSVVIIYETTISPILNRTAGKETRSKDSISSTTVVIENQKIITGNQTNTTNSILSVNTTNIPQETSQNQTETTKVPPQNKKMLKTLLKYIKNNLGETFGDYVIDDRHLNRNKKIIISPLYVNIKNYYIGKYLKNSSIDFRENDYKDTYQSQIPTNTNGSTNTTVVGRLDIGNESLISNITKNETIQSTEETLVIQSYIESNQSTNDSQFINQDDISDDQNKETNETSHNTDEDTDFPLEVLMNKWESLLKNLSEALNVFKKAKNQWRSLVNKTSSTQFEEDDKESQNPKKTVIYNHTINHSNIVNISPKKRMKHKKMKPKTSKPKGNYKTNPIEDILKKHKFDYKFVEPRSLIYKIYKINEENERRLHPHRKSTNSTPQKHHHILKKKKDVASITNQNDTTPTPIRRTLELTVISKNGQPVITSKTYLANASKNYFLLNLTSNEITPLNIMKSADFAIMSKPVNKTNDHFLKSILKEHVHKKKIVHFKEPITKTIVRKNDAFLQKDNMPQVEMDTSFKLPKIVEEDFDFGFGDVEDKMKESADLDSSVIDDVFNPTIEIYDGPTEAATKYILDNTKSLKNTKLEDENFDKKVINQSDRNRNVSLGFDKEFLKKIGVNPILANIVGKVELSDMLELLNIVQKAEEETNNRQKAAKLMPKSKPIHNQPITTASKNKPFNNLASDPIRHNFTMARKEFKRGFLDEPYYAKKLLTILDAIDLSDVVRNDSRLKIKPDTSKYRKETVKETNNERPVYKYTQYFDNSDTKHVQKKRSLPDNTKYNNIIYPRLVSKKNQKELPSTSTIFPSIDKPYEENFLNTTNVLLQQMNTIIKLLGEIKLNNQQKTIKIPKSISNHPGFNIENNVSHAPLSLSTRSTSISERIDNNSKQPDHMFDLLKFLSSTKLNGKGNSQKLNKTVANNSHIDPMWNELKLIASNYLKGKNDVNKKDPHRLNYILQTLLKYFGTKHPPKKVSIVLQRQPKNSSDFSWKLHKIEEEPEDDQWSSEKSVGQNNPIRKVFYIHRPANGKNNLNKYTCDIKGEQIFFHFIPRSPLSDGNNEILGDTIMDNIRRNNRIPVIYSKKIEDANELANVFASKQAKYQTGDVIWINAEHNETALGDLYELANTIDLERCGNKTVGNLLERIFDYFSNRFVVFIFANVKPWNVLMQTDLSSVNDGSSCVILTSTWKFWAGNNYEVIELANYGFGIGMSGLAKHSGMKFIKKHPEIIGTVNNYT